MRNYKEFKKEALKNESVKKAYNELGPEFNVVRMVIEKRIKKALRWGRN